MRNSYFMFGINPRGTTLVIKREDFGFAPEFYLDDLDRRGMHEFCRIFGRYVLDCLRILHHDAMDGYRLYLPDDTGPLMEWGNVRQLRPSDLRGTMRPRHVAVGLSGNGLALEFVEYHADRLPTVPRYLRLTELDAVGPDAAAMSVGDCILDALLRLQPDAFAPFHCLSRQAPAEALPVRPPARRAGPVGLPPAAGSLPTAPP